MRWAVPLYKGIARELAPDGKFRQVVLLGIDDASRVGAPRKVLARRAGEFAVAGVNAEPLIVLGGIHPLHLWVDVDEHETSRLRPEAARSVAITAPPNSPSPRVTARLRFMPARVGRNRLSGFDTW